jgi:hypothetical protein
MSATPAPKSTEEWAAHILNAPDNSAPYTLLRKAILTDDDELDGYSTPVRNALWDIPGYKDWFYNEHRRGRTSAPPESFAIAILYSGYRLTRDAYDDLLPEWAEKA